MKCRRTSTLTRPSPKNLSTSLNGISFHSSQQSNFKIDFQNLTIVAEEIRSLSIKKGSEWRPDGGTKSCSLILLLLSKARLCVHD